MNPSSKTFSVTRDTITFLEAADALLRDEAISSASLHEKARQHLQVFDNPRCEQYNLLSAEWADSLPSLRNLPEQCENITTRDFIGAMYQTGRELDLRVGARYVSAAVCTCAQMLEQHDELRPERLAQELRALAFDVWFLQLWSPFEVIDPSRGLALEVSKSTNQQVMARYVQPRIVTGAVRKDGVYKCLYDVPAINPELLQVVPIFQRPLTDALHIPGTDDSDMPIDPRRESELVSDLLTLYFLRSFFELDLHVPVDADSPRNCLVLDPPTHLAFRQFRWTLRATETPHTYTVKTYGPPGRYWKGLGETVTFANPHRTGVQSEPPDPDLVRAHATMASILHHSRLRMAIGQTEDTYLEPEHSESKARALYRKGGAWTHTHIAKLGKLLHHHHRSGLREV
ncbi:hypothetical protein L227DRAFT_383074 [Lentinus tigrinus ALCF2SS1-6]|uniref:HNH nuclease domain-containing protein n=1 Tax=Lentinus tigrinus ALCF2SS1-6 TaxID=1328759 RepID=A0A5C2RRV7_9APHY|nr:hypothetical protein L227DRAFT_383074 [Lentinus tigrinus ALCF2SS1-6]